MSAELDAPEEPVLDIAEIQAGSLVGLNTAQQVFLFLEIEDVVAARGWLDRIAPAVTTVADVLGPRPAGALDTNVALTFAGLRKLTDSADGFLDLPFREGMHERSKLLGDPVEPGAPGNRETWVVGGPHNVPDIMLLLACDAATDLAGTAEAAVAGLPGGLRVTHRDQGAKLAGAREHFGFRDPVSQPGVRGRLPGGQSAGDAGGAPRDYLTPRLNPANPHHGKPGQNLIWPGEFVFGYPSQDPMDRVAPGMISRAGPAWTKNGSFLVFRRFRQDVAAFRTFLRAAAEQASRTPGAGPMSQELMAAKLVGRWPSGAPLMLAPARDDPRVAADENALNDFAYAAAGRTAADPLGLVCPPAAHIRKVYPRDHATAMDTVASMDTHRLLRRGIPFGPPFPEPGERGLLFVAYQTSIERQFEFITRSWLNHPNLRDFRDGHDPIVGQRGFGVGAREFALPYRKPDGSAALLRLELPDWTVVTGGDYFFAPSISALRHLGAGTLPGPARWREGAERRRARAGRSTASA